MNDIPIQRPFDSEGRWRRILLGCVILIALILAGWMLRAMTIVVVPIIFSLFLALLVAPIDRWGRRALAHPAHSLG
jgi:AI-2 transport protein TqsA